MDSTRADGGEARPNRLLPVTRRDAAYARFLRGLCSLTPADFRKARAILAERYPMSRRGPSSVQNDG